MTGSMIGGCQGGRIRYAAAIKNDDAWVDTSGLPARRADENPGITTQWIEACGKLPD